MFMVCKVFAVYIKWDGNVNVNEWMSSFDEVKCSSRVISVEFKLLKRLYKEIWVYFMLNLGIRVIGVGGSLKDVDGDDLVVMVK